jgi:hypothetical protein
MVHTPAHGMYSITAGHGGTVCCSGLLLRGFPLPRSTRNYKGAQPEEVGGVNRSKHRQISDVFHCTDLDKGKEHDRFLGGRLVLACLELLWDRVKVWLVFGIHVKQSRHIPY